jgi:predicted TIM-barrel fold metal-dependent hydrolase
MTESAAGHPHPDTVGHPNPGVIDCDQHLYETRSTWIDHIDPARRDDALTIADDELGYSWLTWRGRRLAMADVQIPGDTAALGARRRRQRAGEKPEYSYDEVLPADYWDPSARAAGLHELGVDSGVLFPNYGLLWERELSVDLSAVTANMAAWNRWCATVAGEPSLRPVAHLTLRDPEWLLAQLDDLERAGVGLAMIAPALVDGRPLSHPDHDRLWRAFADHGVTPTFHVADQPRVFGDGWYTDDDDRFVPVLESVLIWAPTAVAMTDLILNGVFERHPELRFGIVELSAVWVPMWLMYLDGGWDFTTKLNGRPLTQLSLRPSEYFRRQVRVAAFSYEDPRRLAGKSGDLFMFCSDYPHSEGTASPVLDYERAGCTPEEPSGLFEGNIRFLLRS